MRNSLKGVLAKESMTIKQVMRTIDRSGFRLAYVVDKGGRLIGAVSDSELRKAILKGRDIRDSVHGILNPKPVVLTHKDSSNPAASARVARKLLSLMPDSRFILLLDAQGRPAKLVACADLLAGRKLTIENRGSGKNVLVVGGAGYLGSILSRKLLARGFKVRVLDSVSFGRGPISELAAHPGFQLLEGDMRNISTLMQALLDVDAVINLAAIVGDPACKTRPEIAIETNYLANKVLAEACRFHQINRFVYASTCSVYGAMDGEKSLSEESPLNPVSLYARSKIQSEEGILSLVDENFAPTILRMGTLYGWSPRMRFDLVVNTMTKNAVTEKRIIVHGGGKQWRPLLHVDDAAEAYVRCLEAPISKIKGRVFNVGSREQNYQIIDIARIVQSRVPGSELVMQGDGPDARNYIVSFDKIRRTLGFTARQGLADSVDRIRKALTSGEIPAPDDRRYYNVEIDQ